MTYNVKVIADSVNPSQIRITTLQLTYPRYIHAEAKTHRVFSMNGQEYELTQDVSLMDDKMLSRNASSSRAIPTAKLIENSLRDMVYPIAWGKNQAGMQAAMEELTDDDKLDAKAIWADMANYCAEGVRKLSELGLHKQWANRPLEWFGTITVVVTATDWDNWFELRNHEMAQPEIHRLAELMKAAMDFSVPEPLEIGMWHLPYIVQDEMFSYEDELLLKMSTARCARVSYLTQEGTMPSVDKDLELYERLVGSVPLHASPCEHQAQCTDDPSYSGNFRGWFQHRKLLENSKG